MNFAAVIFISEIGFFQLSVHSATAVPEEGRNDSIYIGDAKGGSEMKLGARERGGRTMRNNEETTKREERERK